MQVEDLVQAQPRRLLHPPVELHEGDAQAAGQAAADGGLARPAQAEQGDDGQVALAAEAAEQLRGRGAERAGQAGQLAHGDVGPARLHLDQEAGREARAHGQLAQGGAVPRPQRAHALAEAAEEPVGVHVGVQYTTQHASDCAL